MPRTKTFTTGRDKSATSKTTTRGSDKSITGKMSMGGSDKSHKDENSIRWREELFKNKSLQGETDMPRTKGLSKEENESAKSKTSIKVRDKSVTGKMFMGGSDKSAKDETCIRWRQTVQDKKFYHRERQICRGQNIHQRE